MASAASSAAGYSVVDAAIKLSSGLTCRGRS